MDQAALNEILRKHKLWLKNDPNGLRANLRHADLADADLKNADAEQDDKKPTSGN